MLGLGKFLQKGSFLFLDHKRLKNNAILNFLKNEFLFFQIGVALLCGVLFMLMVGFELVYDWIKDKLQTMVGRKKVLEVADPAALVGTFKRYK
jgi:hypothetical protein